MSAVYLPIPQSIILLDGSQVVLDFKYYWKLGDEKTFSTQSEALLCVNEKAKQILDNFVNLKLPSSDVVRQSLQSLTSSYLYCSHLLGMMNENKVDTFDQEFYSVEFLVTGLNPDRTRQTETIRSNVTLFDSQVKKTAQLKTVFEDIVTLSRWPGYRDVDVEATMTGEFTVKRRQLYQTIEIAALSTLFLIGIACLVYKITRAYFPSIPAEPS